jgi:hypothetical protein
VEAVSDAGFVLSMPHREVTVSVDSETVYRMPGVKQPGLGALQVGDAVLSLGRREGEGGFLARIVVVLPPMPFGTVKGEVTAIEGQSLTLTTAAGNEVLHVGGRAQFRVPGVEAPTLSDIGEGDRIFAIVRGQEDGCWLTNMVAVIPEGALGPIGFRGRVVTVNADALGVAVRDDEVSVEIADTTKIRVPGRQNASLADIRVGDWVLVVARVKGMCRTEATAVAVIPSVPAHRYVIPGEVVGIDEGTLTVQDPKDQHLVLTDEQTRVHIRGVEDAAAADIDVGDQVLALGRPAENHSLLARLILVMPLEVVQPGTDESITAIPRFE